MTASDRNRINALESENARLRRQVTELQTDNTRILLESRADDPHYQVWEFNEKMNIPRNTEPAVPADQTVRARLTFGTEEFFEQVRACIPTLNPAIEQELLFEISSSPVCVDLPGLVDGWADSRYIEAGSAIIFGVNMKPIAREVHRKNMLKEPGNKRGDGKILKPPGWTPPDVADLLRQQGWRG